MTCCQYPPVTFLRTPVHGVILGRPNFPITTLRSPSMAAKKKTAKKHPARHERTERAAERMKEYGKKSGKRRG